MLRRMMRLAVIAMVLVRTDGLSAAPSAPVPLDLATGVLSQSNCKTAIGCGHAQVSVTAAALVSTGTNSSPAQHILTLDIPVPAQQAAKGSHVIELDYELSNPSGHANNLICAVVQQRQGEVARCGRGVAAKGRLQVPVSETPALISVRFGLMPFSSGHLFAVRNVSMSKGGADKEKVEPAARRVPVRLGGGRLRQPGCATPIGCDHPDVALTDTQFSSTLISGNPPPPSDNPNDPPQLQQRKHLELELPGVGVSKGRRSLRFSYLLAGANPQRPGRIVVSAMTNESIWHSAIAVSGEGEAGFEIPGGNGETESMTVTFEPSAGSGAVSFRISDVTYGVGGPPAGDALPIEETTNTPSRLDPCGPELVTFWVEAADGRSGRGIRCMSFDLTAWYGEGWWNDFDYGWYRHIGYVHQRASGLPSRAHAADLGVERDTGTEMIRYGGNGLADVHMEWLSLDRLRVSTPLLTWNEIWRLIPKGELLPASFVPRPWDNRCGNFGLASFRATQPHLGQRRCAIPLDLIMHPDVEHASTPLVWLGEGRIEEEEAESGITTGVHLGWQLAPPDSGAAGFYAASDVCPHDHPAGCRAIDTISMEVVGPEPPADRASPQYDWWFNDYQYLQGLYVIGPGSWDLNSELRWGHAWVPTAADPGSLPPPTPICFAADCP